MAKPIHLIPLDAALAEEFLGSLGRPPAGLVTLASPAELFERLQDGAGARVLIVTQAAETLDPVWFREVRRRDPQACMLVVTRRCPPATWRRLVLCGVLGVLEPPWGPVDLEAEFVAEPVLSHLFRREEKVARHGKVLLRYRLPSLEENVVGMVHMVALLAMEFGFPPRDYTMNLPLAVDEALTNAVVHGNRRDPNRFVEFEAVVEAGRILLKITDEGAGFERGEAASPLEPDKLLQPGGRGVFLIESVMDEVRWSQEGRCIEMVKHNSRANPAG